MTIPEIETTPKGFKTLSVDINHCLHWGGLGICDSCNAAPMKGKYVAVLNSFYCQNCYDSWHKHATNYPEDRAYEQRKIEDMLFRLSL